MTAPSSSIHKKLIFVSAGCAGLLVVVVVIAMLSMNRLGLETPRPEPYVFPAQSAAAIDSLSRLDFATWVGVPFSLEDLRCRDTESTWLVAPRAPADTFGAPVGFGDSFPPGSPARKRWERLGAAVTLRRSRESGDRTDVDSLPWGRALLAGVRVRLSRGDRRGACVVLAALLAKAGALHARPELQPLTAGAGLARDAADMISRDSALQALTGLPPARAAERLATLDAQARALRQIERWIDMAGAAPASVVDLARWAGNPAQPLPVRDACVRAIGYGWIFDQQEMTFGIDGARRGAIDRLAGSGPESLRATARTARGIMQGNLAQRFRFAVVYRMQRMVSP